MAALDRPGDALDGGSTAAIRRSRRNIVSPSLDTDPRTEGAPPRARQRLRTDRTSSHDPTPSNLERPVAAAPSSSSIVDSPTLAHAATVFDDDLVRTPIAGVPTVAAPGRTPSPAPTEPTLRVGGERDTAPVPLLVTQATPHTVAPPPPAPERERRHTFRRRPKPRVRRVRRVVRSIDTWTVFKLSVLFYLVLYAILMVAGVLLWNLAYATGTIDNLERFFESFGWETFKFQGGELFHSAWIAGLFLVAAGTGLNVVMATVFNLIADLVGGVGVTVLEEEVLIVPDAEVGQRRGRRRRITIDSRDSPRTG